MFFLNDFFKFLGMVLNAYESETREKQKFTEGKKINCDITS